MMKDALTLTTTATVDEKDVEEMGFDGLDYKLHFGINCICGKARMHPIPEDKVELAKSSPIEAFKSFPKEQQDDFAKFWLEHTPPDHWPEPALMMIAVLPEA